MDKIKVLKKVKGVKTRLSKHLPKVLKIKKVSSIEEDERLLTEEQKQQKKLEKCACRIQLVYRMRKARRHVMRLRILKEKRATMVMFDDNGDMNPFVIKNVNTTPLLHYKDHSTTFYEMFYDLIIVVVLMKLSYLKYEFSLFGFFTVVALFSNFFSCWSLLNIYATMAHQEDMLHRGFYGLHITLAFLMCKYIEHPDFHFFNYSVQAFYFTLCAIATRLLHIIMYSMLIHHDGTMRKNPIYKHRLPKYTRENVKRQLSIQVVAICLSTTMLCFTAQPEFKGEFTADETRRSLSEETSTGYYNHTKTIVLWILAVVVEQYGNVRCMFYEPLPFSGKYAGKRMQAWLMLCFGECVIGLLYTPSYYDSNTLTALLSAFIMVFCLVWAYFDITDADQFLNLFILRKEKWKAFSYCLAQLPFSLSVFFVGVALKAIIYIRLHVNELKVSSGCDTNSIFSEEDHRRQLSLVNELKEITSAIRREHYEATMQLDMHISHGIDQPYDNHGARFSFSGRWSWNDSIGLIHNSIGSIRNALGSMYAFGFESSNHQNEEFISNPYGYHDNGESNHNNNVYINENDDDFNHLAHFQARRLTSDWNLNEVDELVYKCFIVLCFCGTMVQLCSVLVAYLMPTDQNMYKVHASRLGSVVIVLLTLVVPYNLKTVKTECLEDYEESISSDTKQDHSHRILGGIEHVYRHRYHSRKTDFYKEGQHETGLSIVEGLVTTAAIVVLSFVVAAFSIDVERQFTYEELKHAAKEQRPAVLVRQQSTYVRLDADDLDEEDDDSIVLDHFDEESCHDKPLSSK